MTTTMTQAASTTPGGIAVEYLVAVPASRDQRNMFGVMLITAPGTTLVTLVTFLGFYWLFTGVLSLVQMLVDRSVPWIWLLLSRSSASPQASLF